MLNACIEVSLAVGALVWASMLVGSPAVALRGAGTRGAPMRAIVQDTYGGADVLNLEDIDAPTVGTGEVLLRVQAASLFAGDWHFMAGMPLAFRPASGLTKPKIRVRGRDVAGRVEAVGPDVSTFHVGDDVYGICNGAFAEFAAATVKK